MIKNDIDKEILQEILNSEDNQDETCISLDEVVTVIYDMAVSTETKYNIMDINHHFLINIAPLDYLSIKSQNMYLAVYIMPKHNSEQTQKTYCLVCDSSLADFFKVNEDKILQKVYIKIKDCPNIFQTVLYDRWVQQLAKTKDLAITKNNGEIAKPKELERTRKISPILRRNND